MWLLVSTKGDFSNDIWHAFLLPSNMPVPIISNLTLNLSSRLSTFVAPSGPEVQDIGLMQRWKFYSLNELYRLAQVLWGHTDLCAIFSILLCKAGISGGDWHTAQIMSLEIAFNSSMIRVRKSATFCGWTRKVRSLRYPQRKMSTGVKFGECADHL